MSTSFEVWGNGYPSQEVVGESFYENALRRIVNQVDGDEVMIPVDLVHTPDNKWDKNAIAIISTAGQIASLPKADAARYAPILRQLQQRGVSLVTQARVWGVFRTEWDGETKFWSNVRIDLPEPHLLYPYNSPPSTTFRLLPQGGAIQVTGEEEHTDTLTAYLVPEGECWVYATLLPGETGVRVKKRIVEVHLDGKPVGRLSPKMSNDLLPVVDYLGERGVDTAVRARVKGNRVRVEVVLYTARAYELPDEWLAGVEGAAVVNPGEPRDAVIADAVVESPLREALPPPTTSPADWYPDPYKVARLRYFDGIAWTGHTAE